MTKNGYKKNWHSYKGIEGLMFKKSLFYILVMFILWGCIKKPNEADAFVTMDRVLISVLDKMGIDDRSVERKQRADGLYYTIPVRDYKEIDDTDREIKQLATQHGLSFRGVISSSRTRIRNSYWSPLDKQYIVIEIYQRETPRYALRPNQINNSLLCIIIDDFGQYNGQLLDDFCELDPAVSFAVIPGLPFSKVVIEKAINSGREVIVHIPMEADSRANPGNNAILSHLNTREVYTRMDKNFIENNFAIGGNNHMGSRITSSRPLMRMVFSYLKDRDFYFIDSRTTPNSVAREIALEMGIAFEARDLFLDAPDSSDAVLYERLRDLQRLKDSKNRALVITHCFDKGRLQRLQIFITEAKKMGFILVPPSQYVIREQAV